MAGDYLSPASLRERVPGEQQHEIPRLVPSLGTSCSLLSFPVPFVLCAPGRRPSAHPSRGASSAQDLAKLAAHAVAGSSAADQVCARFASGSATSAPPELESQNGVLEVTFKFLTATDSQGLVRYCYVTDTGLEAPTLRVSTPATS